MKTKININDILLGILGLILALCLILALVTKKNDEEGFYQQTDDDTTNAILAGIQTDLDGQSDSQLKDTINKLKTRLINHGYLTDHSQYVRKTELGPDTGKCVVSKAEDRDKYVSKSSIPAPGPRVDLSQYIKKTSIPPEKVCPAQKEIDYSAYVKKSSLPPKQEIPACIAPQVKVSAGLCKKCPTCPVCPPPQRCPHVSCPHPKPCPALPKCPPPQPCPSLREKTCAEIKYIKVPTIITKVIKVDDKGNVLSKSIESDAPDITDATPEMTTTTTTKRATKPMVTRGGKMDTPMPEPTEEYKIENKKCNMSALNSEFRKSGIPGFNV
jgi:hypothetical protein